MKILNFIASMDIRAGGTTQSVKNHLNNIVSLNTGHKFSLFTISSSDIFDKSSLNAGIEFKVFKSSYELFKKNNIKNFDLIHIHGIWELPNHIIAYLARKHHIPYIISPRGMLESWSLKQRKVIKKIALQLYQKNDLANAVYLHATSDMESKNLEHFSISKKIRIIPNGIDLSEYLNFKNSVKSKTILFISRIHPKKGIEILIEALTKIDSELLAEWKVEIYGNGNQEYINQLKDLIIANALTHIVSIFNPIYGIEKINKLKTSMFLVLPSYSENFGNIIAEALACKTPVITTLNTPWEDLETFNCGWHIENSSISLSHTILKAIDISEIQYRLMCENARRLIEIKYSSISVASKTLELYESTI